MSLYSLLLLYDLQHELHFIIIMNYRTTYIISYEMNCMFMNVNIRESYSKKLSKHVQSSSKLSLHTLIPINRNRIIS